MKTVSPNLQERYLNRQCPLAFVPEKEREGKLSATLKSESSFTANQPRFKGREHAAIERNKQKIAPGADAAPGAGSIKFHLVAQPTLHGLLANRPLSGFGIPSGDGEHVPVLLVKNVDSL